MIESNILVFILKALKLTYTYTQSQRCRYNREPLGLFVCIFLNPTCWQCTVHRDGGTLFLLYALSEAWSGVNWADLMAAQGAFGTDVYDKSTRTIVGTMLWTEYRPVI